MGKSNIANILEIAYHEAKGREIRTTRTYIGYLGPRSVQCHFGVIQCTCLKMLCNSKTPGCQAKQIEVWDLWATSSTYMR